MISTRVSDPQQGGDQGIRMGAGQCRPPQHFPACSYLVRFGSSSIPLPPARQSVQPRTMARSSGCGMNRFSAVASLLVVVAVLAGACAGGAEAGGVACHNQCPVDIKVSFSLVSALLSPVTCVVPAGATVVAKVELLTLLSVLSIRIGAKVYVVPAQHYPALIGCVKLVVFPSGGPCGHGFITVAAFTKVDLLDLVHAKVKVCLAL